uniref:Uncharacterized protein n=1 Tax=Anguilla anguilla TaxID=7936 RepID=A0A0E9XDM2_ANGAN
MLKKKKKIFDKYFKRTDFRLPLIFDRFKNSSGLLAFLRIGKKCFLRHLNFSFPFLFIFSEIAYVASIQVVPFFCVCRCIWLFYT